MYIGDIIGMFLFCALVMLPAGYLLRDYFPRLRLWFNRRFLSPRYLQAQGIRRRTTKTSIDDSHE